MSYNAYVAKLHARDVHVHMVCNADCGRQRKIDDLFFCGDCSRLSCDQCSLPEISAYFCPSCLNSGKTTNDVFADQNRYELALLFGSWY